MSQDIKDNNDVNLDVVKETEDVTNMLDAKETMELESDSIDIESLNKELSDQKKESNDPNMSLESDDIMYENKDKHHQTHSGLKQALYAGTVSTMIGLSALGGSLNSDQNNDFKDSSDTLFQVEDLGFGEAMEKRRKQNEEMEQSFISKGNEYTYSSAPSDKDKEREELEKSISEAREILDNS